MKVSHNWLQSHFANKLPLPEKIADGLIFHSFEVEGMEKAGDDTVFDVKILPDRAHDCLSHLGIAREISAIFKMGSPENPIKELDGKIVENDLIKIKEPKLCRRYVGRIVRNVQVGKVNKEIAEKLEAIGQRSINSIVDPANFVMFEMGQPLHAFDLDKVKGGITVRKAIAGERIITLDDKDVGLDPEVLVIADDEGPLAIAGIKGGKRAGVTEATKNLLLESANFDPVSIRRSASRLNLHTDASKRFENDYSGALAITAMKLFSGMIAEGAGSSAVFEDIIDIYPAKEEERRVSFTESEIEDVLGIRIDKKEIIRILNSLDIKVEENGDTLTATPPAQRSDINILEDIAEEVGRINGYEKIKGVLPSGKGSAEQNKRYLLCNAVRQILKSHGFSEVYGYSFGKTGEVEVLNPLASDKQFLRINLADGMKEKLELNLKNNILDDLPVKIFEIGKVFDNKGEYLHLFVGVKCKTEKILKKSDALELMKSISREIFGEEVSIVTEGASIYFERNVEESACGTFDPGSLVNISAGYKEVSKYPRIVRDIALFVPPSVSTEDIAGVISENAGPLLSASPILFDVFEKKDAGGKIIKVSYAFRLAFQSYEKTLSDEEVNMILSGIIEKLEKRGWEVRK